MHWYNILKERLTIWIRPWSAAWKTSGKTRLQRRSQARRCCIHPWHLNLLALHISGEGKTAVISWVVKIGIEVLAWLLNKEQFESWGLCFLASNNDFWDARTGLYLPLLCSCTQDLILLTLLRSSPNPQTLLCSSLLNFQPQGVDMGGHTCMAQMFSHEIPGFLAAFL